MIFYFSGTGNTRWAATALAEATGERLLSIAGEMEANGGRDSREPIVYGLAEGERIGFCFPAYGWMPPRIVRDFVKRLAFAGGVAGHYCYSLCTCGDDIGCTMDVFRRDLRRRGMELCSGFTLVMPESYVCLPFFDTDPPEKERRKLVQASADLKAFMEAVVSRRCGLEAGHRGALPHAKTYIVGTVFYRLLITDRPFRVDDSLCVRCRRCAGACPVGNITFDISSGLPVWACDGRCTNCMACYHVCPQHAINYWRTRHKGQYLFRQKSVRL